MSRPARITVNAGDNSWEGQVNTNLQNLMDRPFPILLFAGDLTALQAARPANQYEWCLAIVNYNGSASPGRQLAFSDGTSWQLASNWQLLNRRVITSTGSVHSVGTADDVIVTTGAGDFSVTLPAIANGNKGRVVTIKHAGTGTITVAKTGADTIDGGASLSIDTQYDAVALISDGISNWHVLRLGGGGGGGGGVDTFLELTDAPDSYTGQEGKFVRVNGVPDAVEFADANFTDLADGPGAYAGGDAGKLVRVNATEDGVEFVSGNEALIVPVTDETEVLVAGTGKVTFRMPFALTLTAVRASLTAAASSGTVTIDINEGGSTILSTKLTIDATEETSTTAATPVVISDAALADDAEITIDIDDAGGGSPAGLKVTLIGRKA